MSQYSNYNSTVITLVRYVQGHQCVVTGKILNVETQEMKFHEWGVGVDPDESCWVESVRFNISYLIVVRVFYELGPSAFEEIGRSLTSPWTSHRR